MAVEDSKPLTTKQWDALLDDLMTASYKRMKKVEFVEVTEPEADW